MCEAKMRMGLESCGRRATFSLSQETITDGGFGWSLGGACLPVLLRRLDDERSKRRDHRLALTVPVSDAVDHGAVRREFALEDVHRAVAVDCPAATLFQLVRLIQLVVRLGVFRHRFEDRVKLITHESAADSGKCLKEQPIHTTDGGQLHVSFGAPWSTLEHEGSAAHG